MSSYHLPPPTDHRSPTASTKSPTHQQRQLQSSSPPSQQPPHRRPWTPSSLRDVNLSPNDTSRNLGFPSPPTGHDLMAMFPPNPPPTFPPGPTSGYFHSQERAFFSRAGESLVRVQIDIDMPLSTQSNADKGKARAVPVTLTHHRQSPWTSSPPQPQPAQLSQQQPHRAPSATPISSHHRSQTIPINTIPVTTGPAQPQTQTPQPPHKIHISTHTPSASDIKQQQQEQQPDPTMIIIHDTDESWKRPTPYSERRRAGKQPKRRSD